MADQSTSPRLERAWGLTKKAVNQWLDGDNDRVSRPIFVVGCQRSGTTMLGDVLGRTDATWVWPENSSIAYDNYRLRSPAAVDALLWATPADAVVFKPICDSQYTDRLLALHPDARVIWLWRSWRAVARSAVKKWGPHQREVMKSIAAGDYDKVGWRAERLPDLLKAQLTAVTPSELGPETGASLFWYMRNSVIAAQQVAAHPRVTIARYAHLLQRPEANFRLIYSALDLPFDPATIAHVKPQATSDLAEIVHPDVARLCDALERQLQELTHTS